MTIFEKAFVREAGNRMSEQELSVAMELARRADNGNTEAGECLRQLVNRALFDGRPGERAREFE